MAVTTISPTEPTMNAVRRQAASRNGSYSDAAIMMMMRELRRNGKAFFVRMFSESLPYGFKNIILSGR